MDADAEAPAERAAATQETGPVASLSELFMNSTTEAGSPADVRLKWMRALHQLGPQQLEKFLQEELGRGSFLSASRFDFQEAFARLSELAPERAAALWVQSDALRASLTNSPFNAWAKSDPPAFLQWVLSQNSDVQKVASGALRELAISEPDQFFAQAHRLASLGGAAEIAREIINSGQVFPNDPAKALEYTRRFPEGPMRNAALAQLAASEVFSKTDLASQPEVQRAVAELSGIDAYRAGQALAGRAETLPAGEVRECALRARLAEQAGKDSQSAALKLGELAPSSQDYAPAVRGFVEGSASRDPLGALEWALSIPRSSQASAVHRSAALERAATAYFKANPKQAAEWLESAPLTSEEYFQLTGRTRNR
jgi:hypothetical protein